jgi:hypothetical protein
MFSWQLCSRCRREICWPLELKIWKKYVCVCNLSWLEKGKALFFWQWIIYVHCPKVFVLQAFVIWWELWIAVVDGMLAILSSALETPLPCCFLLILVYPLNECHVFPSLPDVLVHLFRISVNSVVIHWSITGYIVDQVVIWKPAHV